MTDRRSTDTEAPACVLALILAADGSVSDRALTVLDGLEAFERLGVRRERFIELAHDCIARVDLNLSERSWLTDDDIAQVEAVLARVDDDEQRALVCRLAAAAIDEEGLVIHGARLLFDHVLAFWRIDPASLRLPRHDGRSNGARKLFLASCGPAGVSC